MDKDDDLMYRIGVCMIPGIGNMNAKKLIAWCDDPARIFKGSWNELFRIPGMNKILNRDVNLKELLIRAEQEVTFIRNSGIKPLYYYSDDYPENLKHCADSPLMLYYKGCEDVFEKRIIAVVGTRKATAYGRRICQEIIEDFAHDDVLILSGMAYGIDSCAHRKALSCGLETVGVMGHGLDRIYPNENRNIAARMLRQGGLLTEFMSQTNPDRENFPKRNRIIAGLADVVLVVE